MATEVERPTGVYTNNLVDSKNPSAATFVKQELKSSRKLKIACGCGISLILIGIALTFIVLFTDLFSIKAN